MRNLALREFQQRGAAAVERGLREPLLLTGRGGPRFFLVPVQGNDVDFQYRELLKALALASLRAWQLRSEETGLGDMTPEEVEAEIRAARTTARRRRGADRPAKRRRR